MDRARHTVPPPPGRLALPSPPHRHPLHARASGSAAAACRGPLDHRLAAPFPPRCLQHLKQTTGWAGGKKSIGLTICVTSDNERSELCRCVCVLILDASDRERWAYGRHVGVGLAALRRLGAPSSPLRRLMRCRCSGMRRHRLPASFCCLPTICLRNSEKPQTPLRPPEDKPTGLREALRSFTL